ncbi:MAG: VWA domain-containing protein [Candidatus Thiodiazotropha endolucinida]|nr:VWA domain-containing protein [Candidatus Thiodiazotropha taylori]MCG8092849.1 VWA domain-containing protein [Candidatus Thiodiazotropha endolucinida]MCG8104158.1 VWA domain-containing protein [Candidatus Thiodiazotropha taylori]MCG8121625.1 VWA domain-containing protein [Candidatus Thiodiazotropha taylori]MCW4266661.1 PilC/PilY family type IV pilus protein [Candidatus Thiodiazotropha endolucinida]
MNTFRSYRLSHRATLLGLLLGATSASLSVLADDIEIYLHEPTDPVPPNVLFVLDESGSMSSGSPSRRDRLEDAMRTLINDSDMENVNAAMLGYTTDTGNNGPLFLRALSGNFALIGTNRSNFLNAADNLETRSYTPTVKAMEAAVDWFRRDRTFTDANDFATTSPIAGTAADNWCRPNHMVVLTDGLPNSNSLTDGDAYGLDSYENSTCVSDETSRWQNGRCAREIARYAFNTDLEPSDAWQGTQNIVTHTIGFDTDDDALENFMRSISDAGGGSYYPATSAADLISAFTSIVVEAQQSIPYAYTAPVIPFNQDNAAVSGDRIFVPLLVPEGETFWKGNMKSYTITTVTSNGETSIVLRDANGQPIINDSFEFVSSQDHWGSGNDGGDPLVGGAASNMLAAGSRNIYTNVNPDTSVSLSDSTNRVHRNNTLITNALLNVGTDATRTEVLDWISWEDALNVHEGEMGAPIHTQPSVVNYSGGHSVVYLPTSEGVLEAIDADTGEELWAFMPSDLLDDIQTLKNNNDSTVPHYGLDGPLTVYETGNRTMAIFGMRHGGHSYYLLDITDRLNPLFVTQISDPDPSSSGSDYDTLGQTWSKPLLARMFVSGSVTDVLVFGGGYDPDQDGATSRADDDQGNGIYIIRASDGTFIRRISNSTSNVSGMNNSIPSDVLPFDVNRNGTLDRLYAADVGGRIIRIDIPEDGTSSLSGGVIADINSSTSLPYRRFFNTPEVGYYNRGGRQYLAVLIGSGDRTSPLDQTLTDQFYMIKDPNVWAAPTSYVTVTYSDLYNATDNLIQDGSDSQMLQAQADLSEASGWRMDLVHGGEKSFSKAVLYNYAVLFTTYSAERSGELASCEARGAVGTSRFYTVNMTSAAAMFDGLGGSEGTLDGNDRSTVLSMAGMPPTPTLVFPDVLTDDSHTGGQTGVSVLGSVVKAMVGLEEVNEWPLQLIPIWWEEVIP